MPKIIKKKTLPKKPPVKKAAPEEGEPRPATAGRETPKPSGEKYFESVGRRKTSSARVRLLTQENKEISVNNKPYRAYFPVLELQEIILSPLKALALEFGLQIKVRGGGIHSQAEAVRHGIARALILFNADFRKRLKKAGFLTRDPRMRERKKFGLKRARRAPQWRKR